MHGNSMLPQLRPPASAAPSTTCRHASHMHLTSRLSPTTSTVHPTQVVQTLVQPYRSMRIGYLALASLYVLLATVYLMLYLPET